MASSHKNQISNFINFSKQYFFISTLFSLTLFTYSYWSIVKIRYFSDFFGSPEVSERYQELFIAGFSNNLTKNIYDFLPIVLIGFLTFVVAYTIYNTYKNTNFQLQVTTSYINAKKHHPLHIALHFGALYSAAFVLPLLFWCFYFINWFPVLAALPLRFIVGSSPFALMSVIIGVFLITVLLTHFGLVLTRLVVRLFKVN